MKATIRTASDRQLALDAVSSLPLGGLWAVEIKEATDDYTARQRALYFKWCGEISAVTGETKNDVHHRLKKTHLCPIYERDDPSGYGVMIAAVREVWKGGQRAEASDLFSGIAHLTSITDASKKQMSEYMDDIWKECINNQIWLTQPGGPEE